MLECMRCNADLFFFLLFHHIAIMPTRSRSLVEPLAFKTEQYRSKKAEKETHSGTHITHTVHSAVCNHHLITTPSLPELKPVAVYCFCPSLSTYLGNIASLFFLLLPSLPLFSLSLTQSLSMEVKEDKQSLSTDIWSNWTQFGTVQSFFFLYQGTGGEKNEQIVDLSFIIWLRSTDEGVEYNRTD